MALLTCPDCAAQHSDAAPACPRCGRPNAAAPAAQEVVRPLAKLQKKTVAFGAGSLVQLLGAAFFVPAIGAAGFWLLAGSSGAAFFFGLASIPGFLFGVGLFMWGSRLATRWLCGACGVQLSGDEVRLCPSCKSPLEYDAR